MLYLMDFFMSKSQTNDGLWSSVRHAALYLMTQVNTDITFRRRALIQAEIQPKYEALCKDDVPDTATRNGSPYAVRPTKRNAIYQELLERLKEYLTSCKFVGEIPSLQAKPCNANRTETKDGVFGCLSSGLKSYPVVLSLDDIASSLEQCHRDLLIRIYERQEEILQRLKAQAAHDNNSAKSKENLVVPIGVKNAVKQGYKDGEEKSLSCSFEGKRVSDAVNKNMTSHIVTFVKGWNPAYNDITV
ncbi:unnamed protein product [Mytilus coruscus]|uniref:Uncharacterized protein n=1 Tax=Mytilus coruscus TaxID=42192 RepID=A0A6J8EKF5_MYTCO|nr:unnamed protein product [Mytilus coruscus]